MLKLSALTKRYDTGDLALNQVDLEIPDAQVLALIGPSGAGKSTLIRCVNRLVEPTSGSATLNDCLLYTSDAADEGLGVDLGGRRIIKKKIKEGSVEVVGVFVF